MGKQLRSGDIIFWIRSTGPDGVKDRVPMYYKGRVQACGRG